MASAAALPVSNPQATSEDDVLYIGDGGTDTIKSFDANTGAPVGESDGPGISGLAGPRGIVVSGGQLLVVNQNVGLDLAGEVLRFDTGTGTFLGALVASTGQDAPFAPDGIVLGGAGDLFVGNMLRKPNSGPPGRVNRYDAGAGVLLGCLKMKTNEHHPRGVVFGPDGLLYVSTRDFTNGQGGTVLRFYPDGKSEVFIDDKGGVGQLNRPDGLVFGPDGRLYVTSFRSVPGDTDSIRIYKADGSFDGKIDLHNGTTDTRVFAQALLFGPGGKLFVPVSTSATPASSTGEVRCYNSPITGDYSVFVTFESGLLLQPLYLTFGKTNPSTLDYDE
jgi:DNA-binding beta-propeller fold protein YncE